MKISIVGTGYVGLVTGAIFSDLGNEVCCIDINTERIEGLKKGKVPFFEPEMEELVSKNVNKKRLNFTTNYSDCIPESKVVFIAVGTPPKENGEADLTQLFSAVEETAKHLKGYTIIAIKSTIPIGYEKELEETVRRHSKAQFEFAATPEFLREGTAIEDALHPDRIVIGTNSQKAQKVLLEIHAPLSGQRIICDIRSAQLIKYAANSFLATKISFANGIATLSEKMGADGEKVLEGVAADKRIGASFMHPGLGYGGSCLPKDVMAFLAQSKKFGFDFGLLSEVDAINSDQVSRLVDKAEKTIGSFRDKTIGVWGLSFKPNTDDMREAPALKLITNLLAKGAKVKVYDPVAMPNAKKIIDGIQFAKDAYDAADGVDLLFIATEWNEFKEVDLQKLKKLMKSPIVVDGRNIYTRDIMANDGFTYLSVGRPTVK